MSLKGTPLSNRGCMERSHVPEGRLLVTVGAWSEAMSLKGTPLSNRGCMERSGMHLRATSEYEWPLDPEGVAHRIMSLRDYYQKTKQLHN